MKQLIEMYITMIIIMCIICISMQIVMTDTQLSSAKEYSGFITEKLENSGLSEKAKDKIVDATNNNGKLYHVDIDKAETSDGKSAYHIALKYPIMTPFYDIFTGKTTINTGVINSYASVGNSETGASDTMGLGVKEAEFDYGDCSVSLYKDGSIAVIDGDGPLNNEYKDDESNPFIENNFKDVEKIVVNKGITYIDSYAFAGLNNLYQVILPNSVEGFGSYFLKETSVDAITVPSKVDRLTFNMFDGIRDGGISVIYIDNKKTEVDVDDLRENNEDVEITFLSD